MGTQEAPQLFVASFADQMQIHLTEEWPEPVRVIGRNGIAVVLDVYAVVRNGVHGEDAHPYAEGLVIHGKPRRDSALSLG